MIAKRDIASINAVSVIHQRKICEKNPQAFENFYKYFKIYFIRYIYKPIRLMSPEF
jgi:hypothetical protein